MTEQLVTQVVKWIRPATFGTPPPARGGASGVAIGNLFLVFGGTYYSGDGKYAYLNDLWALDTDTHRWHKPKCTGGKGPGPRYCHTACAVGYKLYIFGGKGEKGILYNDLWSLDCESWTWELIPCTTTPPCSRMGSSMIGVLDKLALFGGWDGSSTFNDFWMFDLTHFRWIKPPVTGLPPSPRHGHTALYDDAQGRMLIFGGCCYDKVGCPEYLTDIKELEMVGALEWLRTRPGGIPPSPGRYWHTCCTVGNVLCSIGGWHGPEKGASSNGGSASPSRSKAGGGGSTTTGGAGGAAATPSRAGTTETGGAVGGAADSSSSSQVLPPGSTWISIPYTVGMGGDALAGEGAPMRVPYGKQEDTHFFDLDNREWVHPLIAGKPPGYRYGSCSASIGPCVYIFGGWEGNRPLQELLLLDLSALVAAPPPGAGDEGGAMGGGEGSYGSGGDGSGMAAGGGGGGEGGEGEGERNQYDAAEMAFLAQQQQQQQEAYMRMQMQEAAAAGAGGDSSYAGSSAYQSSGYAGGEGSAASGRPSGSTFLDGSIGARGSF